MTLWQGGDLQDFDAVHAEQFVDHSAAGRSPDRAGFRRGIQELYVSFPEFRATVDFVTVDEMLALATIRWSAVSASTRFAGIEIIRCRAEQVVERWGEWSGPAP